MKKLIGLILFLFLFVPSGRANTKKLSCNVTATSVSPTCANTSAQCPANPIGFRVKNLLYTFTASGDTLGVGDLNLAAFNAWKTCNGPCTLTETDYILITNVTDENNITVDSTCTNSNSSAQISNMTAYGGVPTYVINGGF